MTLRLDWYNKNTFAGGLEYGSENKLWFDKVNSFLIAISPILQHYKGIFKNAGFSVLAIVMVLAFFRLLIRSYERRVDGHCFLAIFPLVLFQIYKIFNHSVSSTKILYGVFMLIILIEIAAGTINTEYIVKYATIIGSTAAICLIIQYISFYLFGKHIIMVPISLLLPESEVWIMGVKTGLYGLRGVNNGFYRPSAFFLEPSHLFLFCFPMLCINLLFPQINSWRKRKAVLITIGILLSTSGMGIIFAVMIWGVYYLFYYGSKAAAYKSKLLNLFNGRNMLLFAVFLVVVVVAYFRVPVFQKAINRILGAVNGENSSAIDGRTRLARGLIQGISGSNLLFGVTDNTEDINFNLSGFFATIYKHGITGILLSYWFYIQGLFKLKYAFFWISFIIVVISFFSAHTHGTFYMLYYTLLLMSGYHMKSIFKGQRIQEFLTFEKERLRNEPSAG